MNYVSNSLFAVLITCATPGLAQNAVKPDPKFSAPLSEASVSASPAPATPSCELHVFPTKIIDADVRSGLDSAVGGVPMGVLGAALAAGAVAVGDHAAYGKTVMAADKQLQADLSPDNQLAVLKKINLLAVLKLDSNTQIVWEPAPISEADFKNNPSLESQYKRSQDGLKKKTRMSSSEISCYNELVVTGIGFSKSGMYSRLNSFFEIRRFWGKPKTGDYINDTLFRVSLKNFPAKQPDQEAAAVEGVQEAFAKDFTDWAARKVK